MEIDRLAPLAEACGVKVRQSASVLSDRRVTADSVVRAAPARAAKTQLTAQGDASVAAPAAWGLALAAARRLPCMRAPEPRSRARPGEGGGVFRRGSSLGVPRAPLGPRAEDCR